MKISNLKTLRVLKGLSQYDLAKKLHCTQTRISLIETGYREPTDFEIKKLSRILGHDLKSNKAIELKTGELRA